MQDRRAPSGVLLAATVGLAFGAVFATAVLALDRTAAETSLPVVNRLDTAAARVLVAALTGAVVAVAGFAYWVAGRLRGLSGVAPDAVRANPLRVGTVVGALTLALLVLGSLPAAAAEEAPHVSVVVAVLGLAGAFTSVLAGIRDAFATVDVHGLVRRMADEAAAVVRSEARRAEEEAHLAADVPEPTDGQRVDAGATGWVTAVDAPRLLAGLPAGAHARLEVRPGEFVVEDTPVLTVRSAADQAIDVERVREAITLSDGRDRDRDIELRLQELADVGEQNTPDALPDVTTVHAVAARLRPVLGEILARRTAPSGLADDAGRRLARPNELTMDDVVRASLDRLRLSAGHLPGVAAALTETATVLRAEAERRDDAEAARALAAFVRRARDADGDVPEAANATQATDATPQRDGSAPAPAAEPGAEARR